MVSERVNGQLPASLLLARTCRSAQPARTKPEGCMGIQAAPWRFSGACREGTMPIVPPERETIRSKIVGWDTPVRR